MTTPAPPGEARRNLLRILYWPVTWFWFIPLFVACTAVCGTLGILMAAVDPVRSEVFGRIWGWCCLRLNFTAMTVTGREHVKPGRSYVVLANHQSHFDIFALYGHLGIPFRWVIKKELRNAPFIGWYTARAGHIFVDRSNREAAIASLNEGRKQLTDGVSVLFFPEGTRSRDGRLRPFKKGGFVMAQDMDLPILPVSISGLWKVLPGKSLRLLPGWGRITIHEPIDTSRYTPEQRAQLMADTRAAIQSGLTLWEQAAR